jgi:hypothetical protein
MASLSSPFPVRSPWSGEQRAEIWQPWPPSRPPGRTPPRPSLAFPCRQPSLPRAPAAGYARPCNRHLGSLHRSRMEVIRPTSARPDAPLGGWDCPSLEGNSSIPATAGRFRRQLAIPSIVGLSSTPPLAVGSITNQLVTPQSIGSRTRSVRFCLSFDQK